MIAELPFPILLASVLAASAPLIIIALGETLTEKGGVINLSLDGVVLLSAMAAFAVAKETDSLLLGFFAGGGTGVLAGVIVGYFSISLHLSQVAVGFALSLLSRDLAYFLGNPYSRVQGLTLLATKLPFYDALPSFLQAILTQPLTVPFAFLLIGLLWYFFTFSRSGLCLRSVGENPAASFARGLNPTRIQMAAVLAGSFLVGIGGAAYSLSLKPGWGRPQGAEGIGWIALALVIFGGWHPLRVALGAMFFAFLQVSGIGLQSLFPSIPSQVFQTAPFPLMIFTLIFMHYSTRKNQKQGGPTGGFQHLINTPVPDPGTKSIGENLQTGVTASRQTAAHQHPLGFLWQKISLPHKFHANAHSTITAHCQLKRQQEEDRQACQSWAFPPDPWRLHSCSPNRALAAVTTYLRNREHQSFRAGGTSTDRGKTKGVIYSWSARRT
ncbi:MAG: ABC transporter permease [Proteobacteria bacterium]|nr:ABC transporter permease [Pseudomonadota bacterium]MBU1060328.1 ABC transporter permease [Pseudomonadota bacterium]